MLPARNIGCAVGAFAVADGHIHDLAIELRRAKDEVEVAKWIEVAKVGTVGGDLFVIFTPHHLGPTQCILDGLPKQPGECKAEEFVAKEIQCPHGFFFHRVDETYAVDELAFAGGDRFVESRQVFRRDGQVGIEDHEDVTRSFIEAEPNGVGFANAWLTKEQARGLGVKRHFLFDGFVRFIFGMSLHEDQLGL